MNSTTNIHNVVSIRLRVTDFGDFVSNELTFKTVDGSTVTVSGFAKERLSIEESDTQRASESNFSLEPA